MQDGNQQPLLGSAAGRCWILDDVAEEQNGRWAIGVEEWASSRSIKRTPLLLIVFFCWLISSVLIRWMKQFNSWSRWLKDCIIDFIFWEAYQAQMKVLSLHETLGTNRMNHISFFPFPIPISPVSIPMIPIIQFSAAGLWFMTLREAAPHRNAGKRKAFAGRECANWEQQQKTGKNPLNWLPWLWPFSFVCQLLLSSFLPGCANLPQSRHCCGGHLFDGPVGTSFEAIDLFCPEEEDYSYGKSAFISH
jgi:hypothetical protein